MPNTYCDFEISNTLLMSLVLVDSLPPRDYIQLPICVKRTIPNRWNFAKSFILDAVDQLFQAIKIPIFLRCSSEKRLFIGFMYVCVRACLYVGGGGGGAH